MDARGFASARQRTYRRLAPVTAADRAFVGGAVVLAAALLGLSALSGWLRFWDGRFSA